MALSAGRGILSLHALNRLGLSSTGLEAFVVQAELSRTKLPDEI